MSSKELVKLLETKGWELKRIRGSHHTYVHPEHSSIVTVPHPRKDLGTGLVHKILKQAGLK